MIFKHKILAIALLGGAVAGLGGTATVVHADAQADARASLKRGKEALDRADPRTARVELMNAIKADPKLAEARVLQAQALLMLGDGKGGQGELERAQALGAPVGPMRHLLAHAALLQGNFEEALKQASAADADPKEEAFRLRMEAQALQGLGRYDEAAHAFDATLRLTPKNGQLWADIARFHLAIGDMAAALNDEDRALELAPNAPDILLLRALLVREQYGPEASRQWFERALAVDPAYVPALLDYAATMADLGRASQALALTRRALSSVPNIPRAYYIQAVIAARAGNYELARSMLGYTKGALDWQAGVRLLRGALYLESHDDILAVQQLEPLLADQPLNIRVRLLLARAYYGNGQYVEAERTLFPLVERSDAGSYSLTLAARIHEAMGNQPVADGFLQRASSLRIAPSQVYRGAGSLAEVAGAANANPALAAPNLRYIRALLEANQPDAALKRARILAKDNGGAPAALVVLGDALMATGRYAEAAGAFEQAANIRFRQDVALRTVDAWRRAGQPDKAQAVLGLYVAQNPMDVEGQRLTASFLLGAGEYARASVLLSVLKARIGTEDSLLMANLARAYLGLKQPETALSFAAHAYRLQPMGAVPSDIFGWAWFKSGRDGRKALEYLEKAQSLAPDEPLVNYHLGQVYAAVGDKDKAKAALGRAASSSEFADRDAAAKMAAAL